MPYLLLPRCTLPTHVQGLTHSNGAFPLASPGITLCWPYCILHFLVAWVATGLSHQIRLLGSGPSVEAHRMLSEVKFKAAGDFRRRRAAFGQEAFPVAAHTGAAVSEPKDSLNLGHSFNNYTSSPSAGQTLF